jgi:hypothetical protein
MKPTRLQYVFAHSVTICTWGGALALAVFVGRSLLRSPTQLLDKSFLFWFVFEILISLALGWTLSGFFISPFVCTFVGKLNGAPFHVGDLVQILVGQHQDHVARVYDVWAERRQLRIELSEQERNDVTDVFDYFQICKLQNAEQIVGRERR